MERCIFCDIAAKQAPASWVYDDDRVFAIMDIVQPNPYKVLIIPKAHRKDLYALTPEEASAVFQAAVKLGRTIKRVSGCDGLNLLQSNGPSAGQTVFHFHLHLFPRFSGDGIQFHWNHHAPPKEKLDEMAEGLKAALDCGCQNA